MRGVAMQVMGRHQLKNIMESINSNSRKIYPNEGKHSLLKGIKPKYGIKDWLEGKEPSTKNFESAVRLCSPNRLDVIVAIQKEHPAWCGPVLDVFPFEFLGALRAAGVKCSKVEADLKYCYDNKWPQGAVRDLATCLTSFAQNNNYPIPVVAVRCRIVNPWDEVEHPSGDLSEICDAIERLPIQRFEIIQYDGKTPRLPDHLEEFAVDCCDFSSDQWADLFSQQGCRNLCLSRFTSERLEILITGFAQAGEQSKVQLLDISGFLPDFNEATAKGISIAQTEKLLRRLLKAANIRVLVLPEYLRDLASDRSIERLLNEKAIEIRIVKGPDWLVDWSDGDDND
jgi:hypothetical protein